VVERSLAFSVPGEIGGKRKIVRDQTDTPTRMHRQKRLPEWRKDPFPQMTHRPKKAPAEAAKESRTSRRSGGERLFLRKWSRKYTFSPDGTAVWRRREGKKEKTGKSGRRRLVGARVGPGGLGGETTRLPSLNHRRGMETSSKTNKNHQKEKTPARDAQKAINESSTTQSGTGGEV